MYIDIDKADDAYESIECIGFNIAIINTANATKSEGDVEFEYNGIDDTVVDDEEDTVVEEEDADEVTNVAGPSSSTASVLTPARVVALSLFLTLSKPKEVIEISDTDDNAIIISVREAPLNPYTPEDKLELCPLNCKEICKTLIEILRSGIIRADVITF